MGWNDCNVKVELARGRNEAPLQGPRPVDLPALGNNFLLRYATLRVWFKSITAHYRHGEKEDGIRVASRLRQALEK